MQRITITIAILLLFVSRLLSQQDLAEVNKMGSNNDTIVSEKEEPAKIAYGPVIGLNVNSIKMPGYYGELSFLMDHPLNNSVYPSAGIFFTLKLPAKKDRILLHYVGAIGKRKFNSEFSYRGTSDPSSLVTYSLGFSQITFNNTAMVGYAFPKSRFRPSFHVGMFFNHFIETDYTLKLNVVSNSGTQENVQHASPFRKNESGLCTSLCMLGRINKKQDVRLEFQVQFGNGLYRYMRSTNFIVYLGLQIGD